MRKLALATLCGAAFFATQAQTQAPAPAVAPAIP